MSRERRRLETAVEAEPRLRRWLHPEKGLFKLSERLVDRVASRYVFPKLTGVEGAYSHQLSRDLLLTDVALELAGWPGGSRLRGLLLSDLHVGPFLAPAGLDRLFAEILETEQPDWVALAGDVITGRSEDLDGFRPVLRRLAAVPQGAWFCFGNHEYFSEHPDRIGEILSDAGIHVLRNVSAVINHDGAPIVIGGIDDRVMGTPDWGTLVKKFGTPHVLLAHNPDDFFMAAERGIPLVLSGHTHGGQMRLPGGPPIVRQSRHYLDEGLFAYGASRLIVSRGVGVSGLPWRVGALPEAVVVDVSRKENA